MIDRILFRDLVLAYNTASAEMREPLWERIRDVFNVDLREGTVMLDGRTVTLTVPTVEGERAEDHVIRVANEALRVLEGQSQPAPVQRQTFIQALLSLLRALKKWLQKNPSRAEVRQIEACGAELLQHLSYVGSQLFVYTEFAATYLKFQRALHNEDAEQARVHLSVCEKLLGKTGSATVLTPVEASDYVLDQLSRMLLSADQEAGYDALRGRGKPRALVQQLALLVDAIDLHADVIATQGPRIIPSQRPDRPHY